jgi:hypothetical protein
VELVLRWIKIGLAFSRLVDQKGIGENSQVPEHENKCLNLALFAKIRLDWA